MKLKIMKFNNIIIIILLLVVDKCVQVYGYIWIN